MVYIIDRDGIIAYKGAWTVANKLEPVLQALTADSAKEEASAASPAS